MSAGVLDAANRRFINFLSSRSYNKDKTDKVLAYVRPNTSVCELLVHNAGVETDVKNTKIL